MAVTVTLSTFSALDTFTTITKNAATADTDSTAEVFTLTPTKAGIKMLIIVGGTGSGADGDITVSIAAGDLWAAKASGNKTVTKNTEKGILVDTAKYLNDDGTIAVTITPAATDKLLTDHAAYMKVIEML